MTGGDALCGRFHVDLRLKLLRVLGLVFQHDCNCSRQELLHSQSLCGNPAASASDHLFVSFCQLIVDVDTAVVAAWQPFCISHTQHVSGSPASACGGNCLVTGSQVWQLQ